jgi:hypothetical protein
VLLKHSLFCNRFAEKAQDLKRLIRDQVASPLERAVWFVEHVARTKGAHHLKLASRNLWGFQKNGIDAYITIISIFFAFTIVFLKLMKISFKYYKAKNNLKHKMN